ncbi:MAG: hypothetical protein KF774_06235 [Planctomyces sp.]|nr:hypothetical protein [Planctomyces sp.]
MQSFFQNDVAIFWVAIAAMAIIPGVCAMAAGAWSRSRQAELEASMKMRMVDMGMSAEDIERVLNAGQSGAVRKEG